MLRTPSGRPASAKISPQIRPPTIGDHSDGLSTTLLPSASGAAIERAERISAAFQGAIAPTTPTGPAQAHRERTRIRRDDLADRRIGERRALAEEARHEVHLEHREAERGPRLAREQRDDLVVAALEHVGGLEEERLAGGRRRLRPARRGGGGGRDRAVGVRARPGGDLGDEVAVERIAVLERAATLGVAPRAADEELLAALPGVHAHVPLPVLDRLSTSPQRVGRRRPRARMNRMRITCGVTCARSVPFLETVV